MGSGDWRFATNSFAAHAGASALASAVPLPGGSLPPPFSYARGAELAAGGVGGGGGGEGGGGGGRGEEGREGGGGRAGEVDDLAARVRLETALGDNLIRQALALLQDGRDGGEGLVVAGGLDGAGGAEGVGVGGANEEAAVGNQQGGVASGLAAVGYSRAGLIGHGGESDRKRAAEEEGQTLIPHKRQRAPAKPAAAEIPADGWEWRKYGQKATLGQLYPRSYFRCAFRGGGPPCMAKKWAERCNENPSNWRIKYMSEHNHAKPPPRPVTITIVHDGMGVDSCGGAIGAVGSPLPALSGTSPLAPPANPGSGGAAAAAGAAAAGAAGGDAAAGGSAGGAMETNATAGGLVAQEIEVPSPGMLAEMNAERGMMEDIRGEHAGEEEG
ncbi:unnamed protein product [Closterium sp. Yama58-4]|nr:unnamed protein product [Closterium sp. Yama58-4]